MVLNSKKKYEELQENINNIVKQLNQNTDKITQQLNKNSQQIDLLKNQILMDLPKLIDFAPNDNNKNGSNRSLFI